LIELTRLPYCSPLLGGMSLTDYTFYNFHYFAFPLLIILEVLNIAECNADGFVDFDLMYLSELDPTWNDDELAFYTNPEVVLFANPLAQMACMADAAAGLVGKTLDSLFWCAGNWGEPCRWRNAFSVGGMAEYTGL